jgi:hypothetical protein
MTAVKIKRSQVQSFLNTTPLSTATYKLIGDGIVGGSIAMNPKITEETYIHQDSASISVDSYAPKMPVEGSAKAGDDVFEFIDALRRARATLADAETDVVNVWMYETGGPTAYPAEKQPVAISVDEFGGEGGVAAKIKYTINFIGPAVLGTFNASTKAFTPS